MLRVIRSLFSACLFVCLASGLAASGAGFAHEQSDLKPDPKAVFGVLPNGLQYVFYPNKEPRGRLFAYLRVGTGSAYEKDEHRGIAHFLEHMAFNGSENFGPGEVVKYFQSIGMNFGGDVNAFTSFDQTAFSLDLPNTEPNTIEQAFLLLGDYARRLSLSESEIDRERGIILAEMGDRDSVRWRIAKETFAFVYDGALLSQRMPIGTKETVNGVQKKDFDFFYNTWYRPERMSLILVGDTSFSDLKPHIEKAFSDLAAGAPAQPRQSMGEFDHEGVKAFNYSDEEAKNTDVAIGVATRADRQQDTVERRRYLVARDIGEGIVKRRLQKLAKKEDAIFTSGSAYSYDAYGWARHAGISLNGAPEKWQEMLTLAEQELRKARTFGFTEAEIAEAKARYIRSLDVAVMKASTRNSRAIAGAILRSIGQEQVFLSPEGNQSLLKDYVSNLDNDAILAAFRAAWEADHVLLSVTGNAAVNQNEILAAYKKSSEVAVTAPVAEERGEFAYAVVPEKQAKIVERRNIADLQVEQVDFGNGLRVNLRKTDFKENEIQISLRFGAGLSVLSEDKEGLGLLAGMIMIEGGLGKHSREELKSLLAGRTANVGFAVGESHLAFNGYTVPDDLELTLQLMRACFTDPGYRPEAMRLAEKQYGESYREMSRTLRGAWQLKLTRLLARGDKRFGMPSAEVFNSRTVDEVRAWVAEQREMVPLEVSIVGDIDIEACIKLVGSYFGSLPAPKGIDHQVRPVTFIDPGKHTLTVPTKIDRGQVALFWPTADAFSDIRQTRRVSMLARVIGEYLREEVREEIGGAYSPGASSGMSDTYEDYGFLFATAKVDPQSADSIRDAVLSIASRLHKEGTPDELFQRVLLPMQESLTKYRRTNGYWMHVLKGSRVRPQQLEWARSLVEDYQTMTVEEVNAYAKQYLDPEKVVIVTIEPDTETVN